MKVIAILMSVLGFVYAVGVVVSLIGGLMEIVDPYEPLPRWKSPTGTWGLSRLKIGLVNCGYRIWLVVKMAVTWPYILAKDLLEM